MEVIGVVISYWPGRSADPLLALLRQVHEVQPGVPISVRVVCNGDGESLRRELCRAGWPASVVLERENRGYNIGAWEAGWRSMDCGQFLFMQDDCDIRRPLWAQAFGKRLSAEAHVGLLGESFGVDLPWHVACSTPQCFSGDLEGHTLDGVRMPPVALYRAYLERHNIEAGVTTRHLRSLVLAAKRSVLELIGGFRQGNSYGEAIATEIAISKQVLAAGFEIDQVARKPFTYIGHHEWTWNHWLKRKRTRVLQRLKLSD